MNKKEQARQATALYDFLVKMDELEADALAEIAAMVRHAKHKVLRIEERLYGHNSGIIEKMLGWPDGLLDIDTKKNGHM